MNFGRKIRQLQEARPLSQRDLAEKVQVSSTYITKIDKERLDFSVHPSEKHILKIARVL